MPLESSNLPKRLGPFVFETLDRPITGVRRLIGELDNEVKHDEAGRIGDAAMRYQGKKLMRESQALIIKSIGEYLEKISAVTDQLLDFAAQNLRRPDFLEKQKSAPESVKLDIHQRLDPIIQLIQAVSEVEKRESSVIEEKMDQDS